MPSHRVLVCGAGIAGSVAAYWLGKYDFEVVVIERSKADQKLGQGIEIEEPALSVVQAMGIMDELEARKTGELGAEIFDEQNRSWASFPVGRMSPTGALELMRGDLTEILYRAADESANVTYRFETTIQSLRQTQDKVIVDLENRNTKVTRTEEFDFVIGADGVKSRTRQLVMGSPEQLDCYKPVGAFVAYFSIPKEEHDWPYSGICQFPGRRLIWTRPIAKDSDMTSVYLVHLSKNERTLRAANASYDRVKQKQALADIFNGAGWETPRVISQMMKADNFYSDELTQVKLKTWSQDRVALLGDAAWAPTPFTGQGNQLAIIGAFVLAQEMSRNRTPAAFQRYDTRFRAYVETAQNIPLYGYAPYIFVPKTSLGIWLLRWAFYFAAQIAAFMSRRAKSAEANEKEVEFPFDLEMEENEVKRMR